MPSSLSAPLVAPLREQHHVVGFATVVLYRMNNEIGHTRAVPTPGNNIVGEALTLASAACGLQQLDIQRVYELVGTKTGSGIAMCWKDAEAKIVGRTVDLVLRAVARPDQASHCAARAGDLMQELQRLLYSDPRVVDAERTFESQLANAIAGVGAAPVTPQVLARVQEYQRPALAPYTAQARGRDWTEAFGAAASTYAGPEWRDPFDDAFLSDGRDTPTSNRKSHVDGW